MADCLPGRSRHYFGKWYAGRDRRRDYCLFCGAPRSVGVSGTTRRGAGWTWACRRCGTVVCGPVGEPETVRKARRLDHLVLCHRELV